MNKCDSLVIQICAHTATKTYNGNRDLSYRSRDLSYRSRDLSYRSRDLHGVGREKVMKGGGVVVHVVRKRAAYLECVARVL